MLKHSLSILAWLLNLFDPPPLKLMSRSQKIGRVFFLTGTLLVVCFLTAMLSAVGIFIVQRIHDMVTSVRDLLRDLGIIFASMIINAACVIVLLEIRKADHKLIQPPEPSAKPETDLK
jgi:hypothetical protein